MKKIFLLVLGSAATGSLFAQTDNASGLTYDTKIKFTVIKNNPATPVKNQAATGTCWSFSTTSLVESQSIKNNLGEFDLSEMFTVRNIYIEKARNYILRQGFAQFSEGALGHDQIRAIEKYGAMPESVYSGLTAGKQSHDHKKMVADLKQYLDALLKKIPLPGNWMDGFTRILDENLGVPPAEFQFRGKKFDPKGFARDILQFNAGDYVTFTSFTHHPFYSPFILEVPDNFSNGAYMNIPLDALIQLTRDAINKGYTLLWDADVSNIGFMQDKGIAALYDTSLNSMKKMDKKKLKEAVFKNPKVTTTDAAVAASSENRTGPDKNDRSNTGNVTVTKEEVEWDAEMRQSLFENLTTQDDHLMHITGLKRSDEGKDFFVVKNSWGKIGPEQGYINVSEAYFAINTISLIVPKAAISAALLEKLNIK